MVNLSVRPHRRRWRLWLLVAAILVSGTGLAWQRNWLPETMQVVLAKNIQKYAPQLPSQLQPQAQAQFNDPASTTTASSIQAETVALVEMQVMNSPHSQAHTAALHLDTGESAPIPWPNIAGRTKVLTYTVQSGDSLWSIATQFELDLDTVRWSNIELERNPDVLSVGTALIILPVNGAYHLVEAEDTLESIAALYGISEADITAYPPNGLYPPYQLEAGQGLIIPFGNKDKELPKPSVSADYPLAWPMVSQVTGTFSPDHTGIDLGAYYGAMVYAAHGGIVIATDWTEIYGYRVILDHGNGLHTWYAHLKGTPLINGLAVPRGTPVGEVGSTGRSTGPHLHFEVRINGEPVNPLGYLPETPQ